MGYNSHLTGGQPRDCDHFATSILGEQHVATPRKLPKLCSEPDGRAYVRLTRDGKRRKVYLGRANTDEAQRRYEALLTELIQSDQTPIVAHQLTIDQLCLRFMDHAKRYYRKNGRTTSEISCFRSALRPLLKLYGATTVAAFGPRRLDAVRTDMIRRGWCRKTINKHIGRIRTVYKWGVAQEIVAPSVLHSLQALAPLLKGRTPAHDNDRVRPVSSADLIATLRELSPVLRSMVLTQARTGMRPSELLNMTLRQIDRSGDVWLYRPLGHKTEHHDHDRVVHVGPRAQKHILQHTTTNPDVAIFRSRTGSGYTGTGYRWAIRRACQRAGIAHWSPGQLRHTAGTLIRQKADLETARVMLGHSSAVVTEQHYAEVDHSKAARIAATM